MDESADRASMAALQAGNTAELGALFERHHRRLYGFCYRMTGRAEVSEDMVQEVFVRILRYRDNFRPESDFRAWLFTLARNVCNDHFRRSRVRAIEIAAEPDEHETTPSTEPGPEASYAERESSERLHRALLALDPGERELILLARFEMVRQRELAAYFGCTLTAIKTRLHRAVRRLGDSYRALETEAVR